MDKNLPKEWEVTDLSEIVFFQEGPGIRKWQFTTEGIKLINVKNIVNGELNLDNTDRHCSTEEVSERYSHFLLEKDDIVMATSGVTWGKTATVKNQNLPLMLNTSVIRFRSLDKDLLSREYLLLFLNSIYFKKQIDRLITGGCQPNFGPSHLKKVKIILPPFQTQKKIVDVLEKAEKLKEWRAEAVELVDECLKSVFLEMFGHSGINPKNWPLMKAEEICLNEKNAIKAGPFGSSLKKEFYVEKGYKIYGQEQVIRDDLSFGDYYIPKEIYKKLENCKIKEGDILISLVGSYGKISIVPKLFEPGIINPRLMKISLNQKIILPVFFKFLLNSEGIKKKIQQVSHGGTMDIINVKIIKQLDFPIPPIELQNQFVEVVQQVETIKSYQSQSKQQIDNLFDTLMQKAFKGELVC